MMCKLWTICLSTIEVCSAGYILVYLQMTRTRVNHVPENMKTSTKFCHNLLMKCGHWCDKCTPNTTQYVFMYVCMYVCTCVWGESNGKLPPRTFPGCSVPEPYRSCDWALVPAKPGLQGWILMNECVYVCVCVCMYVCMYILYLSVCVHMCVCVCVCVYIYICLCAYIYVKQVVSVQNGISLQKNNSKLLHWIDVFNGY